MGSSEKGFANGLNSVDGGVKRKHFRFHGGSDTRRKRALDAPGLTQHIRPWAQEGGRPEEEKNEPTSSCFRKGTEAGGMEYPGDNGSP